MKRSSVNFDQYVERRNTASVKWDRYGHRDILPMWVADMDFEVPAAVKSALSARIAHGVYGYSHAPSSLADAILKYIEGRYQWSIHKDWLVWLPGAVSALNAACRLVSKDQAVVTTRPIYPPFLSAPGHMERGLISVPMTQVGGRSELDLIALEQAFAGSGRLFLFCNPYNPLGRCFTVTELKKLANICDRWNVLVVSDELHADLVLEPGMQHKPLAAVCPELAERTITLYSPSKAFNLAGLGFSYAVIPDPKLRHRFRQACDGIVPYVNALGYVAAEAAYREGGEWLCQLIRYLRQNRDSVAEALGDLPGVHYASPEATYLAWIDLRELSLDSPCRLLESHGLGLSDGQDFGAPGFVRLNFGCSKAQLDLGLARFKKAIKSI